MRIAVYGIAKNEEKFVKRFLAGIQGADLVFFGVDVTSTDNTKQLLIDAGVTVIDINVSPWDFSKARNMVLDALPPDIDVCFSVDLDEVLSGGWTKVVRKYWRNGINQIKYKYIYSWKDDAMTEPLTIQQGFKIHARQGFRWTLPVHEYLDALVPTKEVYTEEIVMYHYPDLKKERNYNKIIDRMLEKDPYKPWNMFLKLREMFNAEKNYKEVISLGKRFLMITRSYDTDDSASQRAEVMRLISKSLSISGTGEQGEVQLWMLRATAENPNDRTNWVYQAEAWIMMGNFPSAFACAVNALQIGQPIKGAEQEIEARIWDDEYVKGLIKQARSELS
jgi:hypothetical protein